MAVDFRLGVHKDIETAVSAYGLGREDTDIVLRCIRGYSYPVNISEEIEKDCYRLSQFLHAFSDWTHSARQLERNVKQEINQSKYHSSKMAEVLARTNIYHTVNGDVTLKNLIYQNNMAIIKLGRSG